MGVSGTRISVQSSESALCLPCRGLELHDGYWEYKGSLFAPEMSLATEFQCQKGWLSSKFTYDRDPGVGQVERCDWPTGQVQW